MFITRNRTNDLPPSIEIEIIGRLYGALTQILCIAVCLIVGGAIMAVRTGDPVLWGIVGAAVVTSGLRVMGVFAFGHRSPGELMLTQARRWENLYAAAALAFTLVIAALTVRIFHAEYTDGYILTVGLTMGLSSGVCSRAVRFWICCAICTLAVGVLMAALAFTGDVLLQSMAFLLGLYLLSVYEAAARNVTQMETVLIGERELGFAARKDALTGIANRRAFDEALATAAASGEAFALLLLDLDGFKAVNDRLGHAAGDDLLRQVAARLGTVSREGDFIARVGGDEFAIIARGADAGAARNLAERAVARLGEDYMLLGSAAQAGASVGIKSVAAGNQQNEPEVLRRAADEALYAAKRAGKGRAMVAPLRSAA
ncbi:hypothetical protein IP69_14575 [Bosea sp. AAP35]|uniref:GGDEF domain-containing protein n=1 Tax=Bosea sp. AAP35 TaxID=1523417 RepID=UPI0006B88F44|nr:diguanylate cyclase [Bosea sp. AAP35]KPF66538.1 hypothetical protein IP69_14575 [Bosea sp. AAP35]